MTTPSYRQDILDQPVALQDTYAGLAAAPRLDPIAAKIKSGAYRQVILTGMGSSFYCFYPLYYPLIQAGVPALMIETSELLHYASELLRPGSLVIAASQSGETAEILHLLEANRQRADILGVTNTPGSSLARQAGEIVLTRAGVESTVSSKTYSTMQMALAWLQDALLGDGRTILDELAQAPTAAVAYVSALEQHVDWLAEKLAGARCIYYTGRGPSLAAVGTAGLTTKESTHFPAEGMSCAAFRHGPFEMSGPQTAVVVFEGLPATREFNLRLAADVQAVGGCALVIRQDSPESALRLPAAPASVLPILEILPVQMITLAIARLHNHAAGVFSYGTKVTTVE